MNDLCAHAPEFNVLVVHHSDKQARVVDFAKWCRAAPQQRTGPVRCTVVLSSSGEPSERSAEPRAAALGRSFKNKARQLAETCDFRLFLHACGR